MVSNTASEYWLNIDITTLTRKVKQTQKKTITVWKETKEGGKQDERIFQKEVKNI